MPRDLSRRHTGQRLTEQAVIGAPHTTRRALLLAPIFVVAGSHGPTSRATLPSASDTAPMPSCTGPFTAPLHSCGFV